MAIHIKENYGPNITVGEGGVVNLQQNFGDLGKRATAATTDNEGTTAAPTVNEGAAPLSAPRQSILGRLMELAELGDWAEGITADAVKAMLKTALGQGESPLGKEEAAQSERLWQLLERGRGDRERVVWQNIVGVLLDHELLKKKGMPALNSDFFGDKKGYTNIDKGRPSRNNMSADFRDVVPLLEKYATKVKKQSTRRAEK